jgi:hypothetical protein
MRHERGKCNKFTIVFYKKQMAQLPILMYHNVSQKELESNGLTISIQN